MSGSGRPLAAAPTTQDIPSRDSGSSNQDPNRNQNLGRKPKRTLIESACSSCRRRKSKCNGARPTCSRCQALRTDCVYEAEEGESRWSALRRHYKTMETERDDLREILTFLQSQPEPEALEILHHIRSSDTQESSSTILQMVRERRGSSHSYSAPSVIAGQTRLPPIRTMIEASEATASPIGPGHFRRTSLASDGSAASYQSSHSGYEPAASQPPSA